MRTIGEAIPEDWSPNGRDVLLSARTEGKSWDLMRLAMPNASRLEPWLATDFNESHGRFSPDGTWVAYDSDETGSLQIYVRSFPKPDVWRRVTTSGGIRPVWSRDGKELFYRDPRAHLMAIPIRTPQMLESGAPREVFPVANSFVFGFSNYDVDPQGRFLLDLLDRSPESSTASIVLNWPTLVRR